MSLRCVPMRENGEMRTFAKKEIVVQYQNISKTLEYLLSLVKMNTKTSAHNFYLFIDTLLYFNATLSTQSCAWCMARCRCYFFCSSVIDEIDARSFSYFHQIQMHTKVCKHCTAAFIVSFVCYHSGSPCPENMQRRIESSPTQTHTNDNIKLDNVCKCLFVWKFLSSLFSEMHIAKIAVQSKTRSKTNAMGSEAGCGRKNNNNIYISQKQHAHSLTAHPQA